METSETKVKNVEEPCVALTIIGENRLSNVEIFVKRGFRFSFKAFFQLLYLQLLICLFKR